MIIVKKIVGDNIVGDNKKSWDSKIKFAFWAYKITKKSSTRKSLFELVYGLDITLHIHLKLLVYQLLQAFSTNKNAVQNKMDQLVELDENRRKALIIVSEIKIKSKKDKVKRAFDKSANQGVFE